MLNAKKFSMLDENALTVKLKKKKKRKEIVHNVVNVLNQLKMISLPLRRAR